MVRSEVIVAITVDPMDEKNVIPIFKTAEQNMNCLLGLNKASSFAKWLFISIGVVLLFFIVMITTAGIINMVKDRGDMVSTPQERLAFVGKRIINGITAPFLLPITIVSQVISELRGFDSAFRKGNVPEAEKLVTPYAYKHTEKALKKVEEL